MGGLELLDLSNFAEASLTKCEVEHVSTSTEAVLLSLKDTTTFEVLVLLFDREVHHRVDHMLKLVRTGHLTRLVDLVDAHANRTSLFAEVGDLLEESDSRSRGDFTRAVLVVIQSL